MQIKPLHNYFHQVSIHLYMFCQITLYEIMDTIDCWLITTVLLHCSFPLIPRSSRTIMIHKNSQISCVMGLMVLNSASVFDLATSAYQLLLYVTEFFIIPSPLISRSSRTILIHNNSQIPYVMALNSTTYFI